MFKCVTLYSVRPIPTIQNNNSWKIRLYQTEKNRKYYNISRNFSYRKCVIIVNWLAPFSKSTDYFLSHAEFFSYLICLYRVFGLRLKEKSKLNREPHRFIRFTTLIKYNCLYSSLDTLITYSI